jgi:hypothetical protein
MYKRIVVFLAVALLVSSTAFAVGGVEQSQSFFSSLGNPVVNLLDGGGYSTGSFNVHVVVTEDHSAVEIGVTATQHQSSNLTGSGNAFGWSTVVTVSDTLWVDALVGRGQWQNIGAGTGTQNQAQSLALGATQYLLKTAGYGVGHASNIAGLSQTQTGINANGTAIETLSISADQTTDVTGEAGATGQVTNGMSVITSQSQKVY